MRLYFKTIACWVMTCCTIEMAAAVAPNYTIPPDSGTQAYTLQAGESLTVFSGYTLQNSGTVIYANTGSQVYNFGTIYGGSIDNFGTFANSGNIVYQAFYNGGTLNLNGGTLSGAITPLGNTSIINVNDDVVTAGIMGAANININNRSTLTINHPLTVSEALTITPSAFALLNTSVIGNVTNNGGVVLSQNSAFVNGNFTQSSSGNFITTLGGGPTQPYGNLTVSGTSVLGGTVTVRLPEDGGVLIANNDAFDILKSSGGVVLNNPTVVQPVSLTLSFTLSQPSSNLLRLVAHRTLYENIITNPTLSGVATALDQIRLRNPTLGQRTLLRIIDAAQSHDEFETDLAQLLPMTNGGVEWTTLQIQKLNFEKISTRMDSLRASLDGFQTGYVAGDFLQERGTFGPMFFGNNIRQDRLNNINGFNSTTGGIGVMGDVPINCYMKLGGAISYAVASVRELNFFGDNTRINNVQGTLYSRIEYEWPFFEAMYTYGFNRYRSLRNIPILSQNVTANYKGEQSAIKFRGGVAIPIHTLEITPLAWYMDSRLTRRGYNEIGAPGATLTFDGRKASIVESAIGLRFAEISEPENFYPELHIMALMYSKNPNFAVTSTFTDGGPSFFTPGVNLPRTGTNYGGSITALMGSGFIFVAAYDLEIRNKYQSQSIYIKLRYLF